MLNDDYKNPSGFDDQGGNAGVDADKGGKRKGGRSSDVGNRDPSRINDAGETDEDQGSQSGYDKTGDISEDM